MTHKSFKSQVFDIPTRLFHWLFAFGFVGAFLIGKFTSDEGILYPLHMLFGALMAIAVILRLVWGFVGSKYARFSSFRLSPLELIEYFKGNFKPTIGRNPASSYAAIAMMGISLILPITGYLMLSANSEGQMHDIKEVHELFATLFALIALLHIAGIIIHTITKHDPIGAAMINGEKNSVEGEVGIKSSYAAIGAVFLALIGGAAFALSNNYDAKNQSFKLGSQTLILGEQEEGGEAGENEESERNEKGESAEHERNEKGEKGEKGEKSEKGEREENERAEHTQLNMVTNMIAPVGAGEIVKELEEKRELRENEASEHKNKRDNDKD